MTGLTASVPLATEATSTSSLARFLITGGIAVGAFVGAAVAVLLLTRLLGRDRTSTIVGLSATAGLVVALVVVVVFQPQKLWIDDVVIDADPFADVEVAGEGSAAPSEETVAAPSSAESEGAAPEVVGSEAEAEPAGPVLLASGEFMDRDHPTSGSALVVELEDGSRILRLEDFATDNGPALQVYLSTAAADAPHAEFDDDFIHLGALKGNIGDQNYDIPAGVDLTPYTTVVIWCDPFNVAFGSAALS